MKLKFLTVMGMLTVTGPIVMAQELDLDLPRVSSKSPPKPLSKPAIQAPPSPSLPSADKPISITVTKTLYLPPAMYGQWNVTGTLLETNAPDAFRPLVQDIWLLERIGDEVVISNPANGASATINVEKVEGNTAVFFREGQMSRNKMFQEVPTITVSDDTLLGHSVNRIRYMKEGRVNREYYAVYQLQATRISGARVQFKPEAVYEGPDLEIEEAGLGR